MYCKYCKREVNAGGPYCPACGMPFEIQSETVTERSSENSVNEFREKAKERLKQINSPQSYSTQASPASSPTPSVKKTAQGAGFSKGRMNLVLADGEVIVKQYNCANVRGAFGYLTVTNKRLMFNAFSGSNSSRLSQEVTLSSVSGISCHYGTNYRVGRIIIGIIMLTLGMFMAVEGSNSYGYGYDYGYGLGSSFGILAYSGMIISVIGGILIILGIKRAFLIAFYAKDVSLSPIVVGEGPTSLFGNTALLTLTSQRTGDTDKMLNEIGALVQDLQSMGDLAIEKWQNMLDPVDLPSL